VPRNLHGRQQTLLREFAGLTDDVATVGQQSPESGGFFGRLKDAFTSR
jgi:hypothetical protein